MTKSVACDGVLLVEFEQDADTSILNNQVVNVSLVYTAACSFVVPKNNDRVSEPSTGPFPAEEGTLLKSIRNLDGFGPLQSAASVSGRLYLKQPPPSMDSKGTQT